jgi:RNA polymerase sigma factor (sigma-70 family)
LLDQPDQFFSIESLAVSASSGDRASLTELLSNPVFRRRVETISRVLYRRHRRQAFRDAEDLEQDIHERIIERISGFDPSRAGFSTWLGRIARNIQFDHLRRARVDDGLSPSDRLPPSAHHIDPATRAALISAFERLPKRQQRAVQLRSQGLQLKEIATRLDLSEGQVSKDLKAAEEALLSASG